MLLIRLYVNGSWRYISDVDQMAHVSGTTYRQYLAGVISMDEIRVATAQPWGGYAEMEYGTITLSPDLFAGDWPPPAKMDIRVCYGTMGESDEQMLLMGSAYLQEIRADGIVCGVYAPNFAHNVTDQLLFGGVVSLFTTHCATFGLTLETGCYDDMDMYWPDGPDSSIEYLANGDRQLMALLGEIAAWSGYRFYIEGTKLVLVHTTYSNGPSMALSTSEILAASYYTLPPYSRFECEGEEVRPLIWRMMFDQLQNPTRTAVAFADLRVRWIYEQQWHNPSALACEDDTPLYPLHNLWDNNVATYWAADFPIGDTGRPQSLTFETSGYYIDTYRLRARNDSFFDQAAKTWRLDAWDGVTGRWRKVADVEAQDWTTGLEQDFPAPAVRWPAVMAGSYGYGDVCTISPSCNWEQAAKLDVLTSIRTIVEKQRARVQLPLEPGRIPKIGQRVTYTDDTLRLSTSVDMKVAAITYNFDTHTCVIEGEATLT